MWLSKCTTGAYSTLSNGSVVKQMPMWDAGLHLTAKTCFYCFIFVFLSGLRRIYKILLREVLWCGVSKIKWQNRGGATNLY